MALDVLQFNGEIIDKEWTLFLDRDGVINERIPDHYINNANDFCFRDDLLDFLNLYADIFTRIIIVTNQQGIGKGLMTKDELDKVHNFMLSEFEERNIKIDKIYYCPDLKSKELTCRKPNPTMGLKAKMDFPEIIFSKSIIIGDSISDIAFGSNLGMKTILILGKEEEIEEQKEVEVDIRVHSLTEVLL